MQVHAVILNMIMVASQGTEAEIHFLINVHEENWIASGKG